MVRIGTKFEWLGKKCEVTGFSSTEILFKTQQGHSSRMSIKVFERECLRWIKG
jgi:hypothetical protein